MGQESNSFGAVITIAFPSCVSGYTERFGAPILNSSSVTDSICDPGPGTYPLYKKDDDRTAISECCCEKRYFLGRLLWEMCMKRLRMTSAPEVKFLNSSCSYFEVLKCFMCLELCNLQFPNVMRSFHGLFHNHSRKYLLKLMSPLKGSSTKSVRGLMLLQAEVNREGSWKTSQFSGLPAPHS